MKKTIGLFGCMVNNDNLGCCALTYSLINLIEKQSNLHNAEITYVIFERNPSSKKIIDLAKALCIEKDRIISEKSARFIRLNERKDNEICKRKIEQCDIVIDLTQGDSFTDIYGLSRFISYTLDKLTVEKIGVPLILGPQTFGPYNSVLSKVVAKKAINKADFIVSRDLLSQKCLEGLNVKKEIQVGTDLAIGLPYSANDKNEKSVGINISGLLWPDKKEGTKTNFSLKCDYKNFIINTIQLCIDKGYDVHLISHVGADYPVCCEMKQLYPTVKLVDLFETPVDAKSFISGLEIFIGSRMHATIAALSSNVPVIPVAYSRKFKGLFENCQYDVGIDLTELDERQCLNKLNDYLDDIKEIRTKVSKSRSIATEKYEEMANYLGNAIFKER